MSSFVNNHASTSRSPDLSRTPAPGSSRTFSVQLSRSEQLEYSPRCNTHSRLSQSHAQNDVNRELIATPLDCRVSRQPTLQPAYKPTFNTFPPPAISHQLNTYYSHHVPVDDHLLNSPSIPHRPGPSSTTGQHVSSHNHLGSYQLSSSSSSRHVAINSNLQRPTTSTPVFNNISDLAAHYGIPQFLPRAPRTAPSRPEPGESSSSTLPVEPFASTSPDFTDLCTNYLTMLSQTPDNNDATDVRVEDMAQSTASPSDAEAIKTLMDVFSATPDLTMSDDLNEYLTSPLMDSPFDELLTTPAFGSADSANILTSPLLDDFGGDSYGELPSLFGDFSSMYGPSKTAQPQNLSQPNFDEMYQISPETPMLDTPATPPLDSAAYRSSQRKTNVNGTRKNITPESLVPIDAPTQQRNYVTPSATSRKAVPAVFARKRARTAAFGDEQDELEDVQINPSMSEQEQIEAKRRQNTIAARRSRKRKLEYQRELEESVEQYKRESEIWKARAMTCQALLRSHAIECPEFPDP